jgi:hypothetical protein
VTIWSRTFDVNLVGSLFRQELLPLTTLRVGLRIPLVVVNHILFQCSLLRGFSLRDAKLLQTDRNLAPFVYVRLNIKRIHRSFTATFADHSTFNLERGLIETADSPVHVPPKVQLVVDDLSKLISMRETIRPFAFHSNRRLCCVQNRTQRINSDDVMTLTVDPEINTTLVGRVLRQ